MNSTTTVVPAKTGKPARIYANYVQVKASAADVTLIFGDVDDDSPRTTIGATSHERIEARVVAQIVIPPHLFPSIAALFMNAAPQVIHSTRETLDQFTVPDNVTKQ